MITLSFHPFTRFPQALPKAFLTAILASLGFLILYKGLQLTTTAFTPFISGTIANATTDLPRAIFPSLLEAPATLPFLSVIPSGKKTDPRLTNAQEEAVATMAVLWARGKTTINEQQGKDLILAVTTYQQQMHGAATYTSVEDTMQRILNGYFRYYNTEAWENITIDDIKSELQKGNILIVPVNGQQLQNPALGTPGPERHMIVVIGFDQASNKFITNDPGAVKGAGVRYSAEVLTNSLVNYSTERIEPDPTERPATAMIVVHKQ